MVNRLQVCQCVDRVDLYFVEPNIARGHGRFHVCRSMREAILVARHYIMHENFDKMVEVMPHYESDTSYMHDFSDDTEVIQAILKYGN